MSLKTTVGTILHARHPMFLWWGPELIQIYNDAYLPSFGVGKHPAAMGQRGEHCWQEIWPIIWPQIDDVMTRGVASWNEDALVPIFRNGRLEDVYWTYGYSPVFDDEGRIGGTLVVCTETTSRVVAVRSLRETSESLSTTLHSIGEAVIATDSAGAVVRMNKVAEHLTGWCFADARGKPVTEILTLVHDETGAAVDSLVGPTLREGNAGGLADRTMLVRRDGTTVAIGHTCAPIKSDDGAVHGTVLVLRDLTAQRSSAELQNKLQKQLIFADRMAAVGTLAAGVAHEINNPLTYVAANIEAAIEDIHALAGVSASGRMNDLEEMLVAAREGAARITKIVRGMKTFSRVEEERRGVIDLVPVLELAINMAFNEIRHRARLVKDYGALPLVYADDARLGQVFINLLVNAAHALPAGHADANEIRIVTWTDAEGRAVVEVRDTGPGIPPEILSRIFDPFFTTKPVGGGTGLGLAICHSVVTAMSGEITAQSEIDRGTILRVVLPASSAGVPRRLAAADGKASPLRPAHVLVIDDEPAIGLAVRRVLRGHEVTVVNSGKDALALLADREYDVILSDLMMPEMSGMDLYQTLIRQHPRMASRVVFVTGGAFTPQANEFLDAVANERLDKPLDFKRLRETVQLFVK